MWNKSAYFGIFCLQYVQDVCSKFFNFKRLGILTIYSSMGKILCLMLEVKFLKLLFVYDFN